MRESVKQLIYRAARFGRRSKTAPKKRKRGTLTVPRLLAQDIQPQRLVIGILRDFREEGKADFR